MLRNVRIWGDGKRSSRKGDYHREIILNSEELTKMHLESYGETRKELG